MEQIVEQYGEYLYHLSYLYMKDFQLAEEITQDVLIKYLLHKDDFRKDASLKTYLTRITINCCHDELRKQKRKSFISKLLPLGRTEPSVEQTYIATEDDGLIKGIENNNFSLLNRVKIVCGECVRRVRNEVENSEELKRMVVEKVYG